MTLEDFGFTLGYISVGIFLGFTLGFFYGQKQGRRTGKIEGWIYAYKELVTRIKSRGEVDQLYFAEKKSVVLVVEDNEDARQMLIAVLKLYGYRIIEARSGEEGLQLAASEEPTVAIIDIVLPDVSGYEVARRLREDPKTKDMRLIALTGYSLEQDKQRALDSGYDVYMTKPYQLDRLMAALM